MTKSELFRKAHQLTKEVKIKYPEVNYRTQFGLSLSYIQKGGTMREFVINKGNFNVNLTLGEGFLRKENGDARADVKILDLKIKGVKVECTRKCEFMTTQGKFCLVFTDEKAEEVNKIANLKNSTRLFMVLGGEVESYYKEQCKIAKEKLELEVTKFEEQIVKANKELTIKYWGGYGFGIITAGMIEENSKLLKRIKSSLEKKRARYQDELKDYLVNTESFDYSYTDTFKIRINDILIIIKNVEEDSTRIKARKEAEIKAIFDKARETGKQQELSRYTTSCNDKHEECDVDIVITYAMADGTTKTVRNHTW